MVVGIRPLSLRVWSSCRPTLTTSSFFKAAEQFSVRPFPSVIATVSPHWCLAPHGSAECNSWIEVNTWPNCLLSPERRVRTQTPLYAHLFIKKRIYTHTSRRLKDNIPGAAGKHIYIHSHTYCITISRHLAFPPVTQHFYSRVFACFSIWRPICMQLLCLSTLMEPFHQAINCGGTLAPDTLNWRVPTWRTSRKPPPGQGKETITLNIDILLFFFRGNTHENHSWLHASLVEWSRS